MIRNALQRFMYGRYGNDQLNSCMMVGYLALLLVSMLTGSELAYSLSMVLAVLAILRALSRNHAARRRENMKCRQLTGPAVRRMRLWSAMLRDKDHRYFKCPSCGQHLRVPRGKGRITVTCRGCGTKFDEKS